MDFFFPINFLVYYVYNTFYNLKSQEEKYLSLT